MPINKDLKRLIRTRMQKTGEAYTAARVQILNHQPRRSARRPTPPAAAPEYARLAGMSDEAVKAKTGCTWERWVYALDRRGAADMSHRDIARLVHEKYKVGAWWTQMVTVGYERIKGLRVIGQRREGTYEASRSRTLPVPLARLYRAFADGRLRKRWLADGLTVRTANAETSMRLGWGDGTIVQVYFTPKGDGKSQVALQHIKLPDRAATDRMKGFWGERLDVLATLLKGAG